jgi:hypothetical protein
MLRPISASAVLRQLSPRKTIGTAYYQNHRLNSVRDESPFRQRVNSVKRKQGEGPSYAEIMSKGKTPVNNDEETRKKLDAVTLELGTVGSLCDKITGEISKLEDNPIVAGILNDMNKAIKGLCNVQETLVKEKVANLSAPDSVTETIPVTAAVAMPPSGNVETGGMISLGNVAKKPRRTAAQLFPENRQAEDREQQPDPEDIELKKFRDAVKSAENSILIFNLDMGRVPIMNRDMIQKKATLALTSMAAKLENKNSVVPSEDTVAAIDDVLSIVKGMEFFGKKTKSYNNSRDPNSGLFCTVPVKYEFHDKEDRIAAENLLREKCGVNCTTPYPTVLRECIKQVVDKVKSDYPASQVKVFVDCNNASLKVSRRFKNASADTDNTDNRWEPYGNQIPLPKLALNVEIRKVPDNFKMEFLPPGPDKGMKGSPVKVNAMEITQEGEAQT